MYDLSPSLEVSKNLLFICSEVLHKHQEKILFCWDSAAHNSFRKYPLAPSLHLKGHFGCSGDREQNKTKHHQMGSPYSVGNEMV